MRESPLEKLVRLAATPVRSYQRVSPSGRPQTVRQYSQSRNPGILTLKFGTPYRSSWGNVNIGDIVEFSPNDLWKVIPASSYPGYKPPTSSGTSTSSGTGSATGGSTTGTSSGTTTASGTGSQTGGSATGAGTNTYTNYLQDVRNPRRYDELTLPAAFIVTVVPQIP